MDCPCASIYPSVKGLFNDVEQTFDDAECRFGDTERTFNVAERNFLLGKSTSFPNNNNQDFKKTPNELPQKHQTKHRKNTKQNATNIPNALQNPQETSAVEFLAHS